jgi:hypothetical protein
VVPARARCRLHGGKSTGPRTAAGLERVAEASRRRVRDQERDAGGRFVRL